MTDLEPFISHRSYELMNKVVLNKSEKELDEIDAPLEQVLMSYQSGNERYHAGCVYNFALFFPILKYSTTIRIPNEDGALAKCIMDTWSGIDYKTSFKSLYDDMNKKSLSSDIPGWVFLTYNTKRKKLHICNLQLHDNPLCYSSDGPLRIPLFAWNLWEHAYYLQFEYRKSNYIKALWYVTDWDKIEQRFNCVMESEQPLTLVELQK